MSEDEARRQVRIAVDAMGGPVAFAKRAQIDYGTLSDFLAGIRRPHARTRTKIEQALGWQLGRIQDMYEGADVPDVSPVVPDVIDVSDLSLTQRRAVEAVVQAMKEPGREDPAANTPARAERAQEYAPATEAEAREAMREAAAMEAAARPPQTSDPQESDPSPTVTNSTHGRNRP